MSLTGPVEAMHSILPAIHGELHRVISNIVESERFKDLIARRLSDAVKIPTVVGDDMGHIGEDPQWNIFYKFSKYMENTFPLM